MQILHRPIETMPLDVLRDRRGKQILHPQPLGYARPHIGGGYVDRMPEEQTLLENLDLIISQPQALRIDFIATDPGRATAIKPRLSISLSTSFQE